MKDKFEFIRLPVILVLLFFVGRIVMGIAGAPYEAANRVFSMVILQAHLAVIWAATEVSYAAGWSTVFNNPQALNQAGPVRFGAAMGIRAFGLIANCITGAILAVIGWLLGGLIPGDRRGALK